jgi:adenosylcobinamide kinase/adenosylcobinamide-phosphate guanylyltransferase
VLYDVTAPDGSRRAVGLRHRRSCPAQALDLAAGRAYDVVLLELTSAHLPHHLDLRSWPLQVAALRRNGAVTGGTELLAVHLGHANPPPAELDRVLAAWGARAPVDGEVVGGGLGARPGARAPEPRAGRGALGQVRLRRAAAGGRTGVVYVATAPSRDDDPDWQERVQAHIGRRPGSWSTVETGDVATVLADVEEAVLVDDLGLWLTRQLDAAGGWQGPVPAAVEQACEQLVRAWERRRARAVLVAPEVGAGVVPPTASGRRFRDLLGALTTSLAAASDDVVQVVAGLPRSLR